jgi:flagellin
MSMSITNYSGAAAAALAGLNNVTSQLTDTQTRINTGKVVNGYADNPSVYYAATLMNRQVDTLKASAQDLNGSLTNINSALNTAKTVSKTLGSIKDALTNMTKTGTTAAQAGAYANTIANLINSINANVADTVSSAAATGKKSLLDNAYNAMNITVGGGTLVVNSGNLSIAAGNNADGTRPRGLAIAFTAQDVTDLLTAIKTRATGGATTTSSATVALASNAPVPASVTTAGLWSSSTVTYQKVDDTTAKAITTVTAYGAATAGAQFLTFANRSIANVDALAQQWGGSVSAINDLLSNNASLQSNLTSAVSDLVDADMTAEQAKLQALQFQQQVSVSAVSSVNQSRQALLSLFR